MVNNNVTFFQYYRIIFCSFLTNSLLWRGVKTLNFFANYTCPFIMQLHISERKLKKTDEISPLSETCDILLGLEKNFCY